VFNLTEPVPPVYLQLYVGENPPTPATRREVIVDRGTGGSGAFGPLRNFGGVFVASSDGKASFETDQALDLQLGQSIAWQSMPGTPPLPLGRTIVGQSYRLDGHPPSVVISGTVGIEYQNSPNLLQAASVGQNNGDTVAIYFWNGATWRALNTTNSTPANAPDGVRLASAPSQGLGVYAVLMDKSEEQIFLPFVQR
jgi:hypothetical protein